MTAVTPAADHYWVGKVDLMAAKGPCALYIGTARFRHPIQIRRLDSRDRDRVRRKVQREGPTEWSEWSE